jgi:hypothetical protein
VARNAETTNERRIDALIGEPEHACNSAIYDFLVSEIIGCECLRRSDVIERKPGMTGKDRVGAHAGAKFT